MFDQFKDMGKLMKMAGEAKQKAAAMQEELENKTVSAESGGGAVRVTMNGKGRVKKIELDQNMLVAIAGEDKEMIEDLIAAAVNAAQDRVSELTQEQMKEMLGGMDLPPGLSGMMPGA